MYVSEKFEFVYMPPQKTGTTSLSKVLCEEYGAFLYKDWDFELEKHHDGYFKHLIHLPKRYEDYFVFASVRNPYERFISRYVERKLYSRLPPLGVYIRNRVSCHDTLCDELKMGANRWCDADPPLGCVSFKLNAVVKLESIDEDFSTLPFVDRKFCLPKLRVSDSSQMYWLDQQLADLIYLHRKCDFLEFGYSKALPNSLAMKEFL